MPYIQRSSHLVDLALLVNMVKPSPCLKGWKTGAWEGHTSSWLKTYRLPELKDTRNRLGEPGIHLMQVTRLLSISRCKKGHLVKREKHQRATVRISSSKISISLKFFQNMTCPKSTSKCKAFLP